MALGFLPALGGGIRALAETGQLSRLVDGYMRPYADAFGEVVRHYLGPLSPSESFAARQYLVARKEYPPVGQLLSDLGL